MAEEPPNLVNEIKIELDYAGSKELNSCSSIDEDELVSDRPKYLEFN